MLAFLMGLKSVSPDEVQRLMAERKATVIDVNADNTWAAGHVPGALHLKASEYVEGDLPKDKQAQLVFYCGNPMCSKAPRAAKRAKAMGYENVSVMSAGISGWMDQGLPTERGA